MNKPLAVVKRPQRRQPFEPIWPDAVWLPIDLIDQAKRPLPPPPAPKGADEQLRNSSMLAWTPVMVVPDGQRYIVLDGVRRLAESRRRGSTHILGIIGRRDQPLLAQYRALKLPITARTLLTWAKNVTATMLAAARNKLREKYLVEKVA
jgi:hypothetical protein